MRKLGVIKEGCKIYYTKSELIAERVAKFPNEADNPDLEHNSLAGYINLMNGLFIHYRDWEALKINGVKIYDY